MSCLIHLKVKKLCWRASDVLCWRCSPGNSGAVQRLLTIWSCQLSAYRFVLSSSWPAAFLTACRCFSTLLILWFDHSLWWHTRTKKSRTSAGTLCGPSGAAVVPRGSPHALPTCCFSLSVLLGCLSFSPFYRQLVSNTLLYFSPRGCLEMSCSTSFR